MPLLLVCSNTHHQAGQLHWWIDVIESDAGTEVQYHHFGIVTDAGLGPRAVFVGSSIAGTVAGVAEVGVSLLDLFVFVGNNDMGFESFGVDSYMDYPAASLPYALGFEAACNLHGVWVQSRAA